MRLGAVLALPLLMAMPTYTMAQSPLPKEGNYDFTSCWSGVSNAIAFSKTHSAAA